MSINKSTEKSHHLEEIIKYKNIAVIIAAIMLVLAIGDWPYGYYTLLRGIVLVASGLLIYTAYKLKRTAWVVTGTFLLLLWNPLAPVSLDRDAWFFLNIIAAILFVFAWRKINIKKKRRLYKK